MNVGKQVKQTPITTNSAANGKHAQAKAKGAEAHLGPNENHHPFGRELRPNPTLAPKGTNNRSAANGECAHERAEGAKAHLGPNANQNPFGNAQGARPCQGEGGRSSFGPEYDPPPVRQQTGTAPKPTGWLPMPYRERIGSMTRLALNGTVAVTIGIKTNVGSSTQGVQIRCRT